MSQTKITVKIYEPLLHTFNQQIDALFIKRDAFLNSMIKREVPHLAEDMAGKKLSASAKRYIAGELKRMGTVQVNIVIDKSTADELNSVVNSANLVRDAFINRLIMLLRSSHKLLEYLELPESIDQHSSESIMEPMPTSPLKAIEAVYSDPLYYLRITCEEQHKAGLYLVDLQWTGFACYLNDSQVPETKANTEMLSALDKELESFEANTFRKTITNSEMKS